MAHLVVCGTYRLAQLRDLFLPRRHVLFGRQRYASPTQKTGQLCAMGAFEVSRKHDRPYSVDSSSGARHLTRRTAAPATRASTGFGL